MEHVEPLETMKSEVVKLLVSNYDFTLEEAEESVEDSVKENDEIWNENASAEDLAKYVASDGDDE